MEQWVLSTKIKKHKNKRNRYPKNLTQHILSYLSHAVWNYSINVYFLQFWTTGQPFTFSSATEPQSITLILLFTNQITIWPLSWSWTLDWYQVSFNTILRHKTNIDTHSLYGKWQMGHQYFLLGKWAISTLFLANGPSVLSPWQMGHQYFLLGKWAISTFTLANGPSV